MPILEKKPSALRNCAPFVDWDFPPAIVLVRDRILKQPKGNSAFVELLLLAGETGLDALEIACELALESGIVSTAIVLNELRRLIAPSTPERTYPSARRHYSAPRAARQLPMLRSLRGETYVQ